MKRKKTFANRDQKNNRGNEPVESAHKQRGVVVFDELHDRLPFTWQQMHILRHTNRQHHNNSNNGCIY